MKINVPPAIVAYVPVLHKGYQEFFKKYSQAKELFLIDLDLAHQLRPLQKDVRAIDPKYVIAALAGWQQFEKISLLNSHNIQKFAKIFEGNKQKIIMPNEEICRFLTQKYFEKVNPIFDNIFLMWDGSSSKKKIDVKPSSEILSKKIKPMIETLLKDEKTKSADWWRQIGAVAIKNGKVLLKKHNRHLPSEQQPYFDGDPRANFHKGEYLKLSTAIHAEAYLIAEAAKQGISLDGAELYVTTFPCPVCAKQIAASGIKKVYFETGYSLLDGEKVLKENGIELIKIKN